MTFWCQWLPLFSKIAFFFVYYFFTCTILKFYILPFQFIGGCVVFYQCKIDGKVIWTKILIQRMEKGRCPGVGVRLPGGGGGVHVGSEVTVEHGPCKTCYSAMIGPSYDYGHAFSIKLMCDFRLQLPERRSAFILVHTAFVLPLPLLLLLLPPSSPPSLKLWLETLWGKECQTKTATGAFFGRLCNVSHQMSVSDAQSRTKEQQVWGVWSSELNKRL